MLAADDPWARRRSVKLDAVAQRTVLIDRRTGTTTPDLWPAAAQSLRDAPPIDVQMIWRRHDPHPSRHAVIALLTELYPRHSTMPPLSGIATGRAQRRYLAQMPAVSS